MAKRYDIETAPLADIPGAVEVLQVPTSGPVIIPGGGLLADAVYARLEGDLLIELADGSRLIVRDYFASQSPPPLASDSGAHVGADVVSALAGVDASATPVVAPQGAPIGRLETVSGDVEIVHPDGTRVDAEAGMLVARADRIETGVDGHAGFLFADESTFAVGENARATFEDLVYDPNSSAAEASFVVQQGTFSFSGGGISNIDGAFAIKTPSATIFVDGASGAGRVEADGGTTVTYMRADDVGHGALRVENPAGTEVLDQSYEITSVDDFFTAPASAFRLGPRDAAEHFGDAVMALPDALAMMPRSLLDVQRHADPASRAAQKESEDFEGPEQGETLGEESALQVDRETAFEIAARKAAIARAARDAADEALGDAAAAEEAARKQAEAARLDAGEKHLDAESLRDEALRILGESEARDKAFEEAIRKAEVAEQSEEEAARAVAETDLAESQAAERLAAAEEAVRQALLAAEQARTEALQILEEAKAKEEAFAEAQRLAEQAKEEEEARALAVAEADAAEEAAAAALRAAEAAAEMSAREAEAAERVAQEASTAAEIVETVVERELAAIDPDLLKPPAPDDPSSSRGEWITRTRPLMDVANAARDAGDAAAREAYQQALREGYSIEEALERAVIAAEAYGGASSADQVIAGGPDGLIDGDEPDDERIVIAGGGYSDGGTTGAIGSDVLIGGAGADGLGASGGGGFGGIDGLFGFGFSFTPIVLNLSKPSDDDVRDDPVSITTAATSDSLTGSALADFLVGANTPSTITALGGNDFIYGDTPTNYLSGTHNISNTLLNPTFSSGGNDRLVGGAGADTIFGGAGDDTFVLGDDDSANDTVYGGTNGTDAGTDTVDYAGAGAAVTIDLNAGTATGANTGTDSISDIENATGSAFDDTITGSSADNSLVGNAGVDTLSGLGGADNIFGYADDDVLIGGEGIDSLTGGTGADEFRFEGGSGGSTLARVSSLGTDVINDYNASEADLFMLSDADFSLGNAGTLTGGTNYFEAASTTISSGAQDLSGGVANAGILILGAATGGGGAEVWYTSDASAVTDSNSYQIATVSGADRSTIEAGDFQLKT